MTTKRKAIKSGRVRKIIHAPNPDEPEKAEIAVHGADELYQEIRIENTLHDENGRKVKLKQHAPVDIIIEADPKDTEPKR